MKRPPNPTRPPGPGPSPSPYFTRPHPRLRFFFLEATPNMFVPIFAGCGGCDATVRVLLTLVTQPSCNSTPPPLQLFAGTARGSPFLLRGASADSRYTYKPGKPTPPRSVRAKGYAGRPPKQGACFSAGCGRAQRARSRLAFFSASPLAHPLG